MSVSLSSSYTQRACFWTGLKASLAARSGVLQYDEDSVAYTIWFCNVSDAFLCTIYKGTVPDGILTAYSQEQNDLDKADFETSYKTAANQPVIPVTAIDGPRESDKRLVVVNSPGREGSYTWITSRGDDPNPTPPASGRGDGQLALLAFTTPDTKEVELHFSEAMQLLGGHVYWRPVENWDFEDQWSLLVRLPATVVTVNPTNTGNCTLFDTQQGFNIIMPAAGDGTHDVNLETAVPVPDGYSSVTESGYGFWNVDRFWSEVMTPNAEAHGEFNLYDTSLEFHFCKNVCCGNTQGFWKLDVFKAEWVSSRWVTIFKATKTTSGAGKIGGHFHVYRPEAI